jgi:aminoglycoside phosphotransferase
VTAPRQLIEAVSTEVKRHMGRVDGVRIVHTLAGRVVAEVEAGGRSVFFKGMKREHESHLETWTAAKLGEVGVPVPEVLAVDRSRSSFPLEYIILAKVQGLQLGDDRISPEQRLRLLAETGSILRAIHSITGEGFSNLSGAELARTGRPVGWAKSWSEACLSWLAHIDKAMAAGFVDEGVARAIRADFDSHLEVIKRTDRRSLMHGDFGYEHVIVDPGGSKVAAIIDFADVSLGDPIWEFGPFLPLGRRLDAVLTGYGPDPEMRDDMAVKAPLYRMLWHLGAGVWCHEVGLTDLRWVTRVIEDCLARLNANAPA